MTHSMQPFKDMNSMIRMRGLTLLEILLAMVIFAIGMLALAHLQTNLTRSSTDANTRTVATNIGEEIMENLRAFQRVSSDPDKLLFAYADIDKAYVDETVLRGGINYTVTSEVFGYDFDSDHVGVTKTADSAEKGVVYDFKVVELTVSWDNNSQFLSFSEDNPVAELGTGSITVKTLIPSIPVLSAAKVAAANGAVLSGPSVDYTPGLNPDVVAINLQNSKFKESTTPIPDVIRSGEQIETWFDVITYSQDDSGAVFLRREEFVSVSCECTISAPSGTSEDGFEPTLWIGTKYSAASMVGRTHGASTSNIKQSLYCTTCCRDHHDSSAGNGNADTRIHAQMSSGYIASGSFAGDHPHYNRDENGVLTQVAEVGDTYVEACRLIRKDGFFRVAQDFSLEALNGFPEDYLNDPEEVEVYSAWVTTAVADHFNYGTSPLLAPATPFPGDSTLPTNLPTPSPSNAISQQLRSRGIYTDHLSAEAAKIIDCMAGSDGLIATGDDVSGNDCEAPGAVSPLEVLPFFDIQTTFLARWSETQPDNPVETTNEELQLNNAHSRGKASLVESQTGKSVVHNKIEKGNVGLIGTVSVGGNSQYYEADVHITASGSDVPPPPSGNPVVTGSITAEGGTSDAAIVSVTGADASCTKPTNETFFCEITGPSPTLTVSNYFRKNVILVACSDQIGPGVSTIGLSLLTNWTVFTLPSATSTGIVITIKKNAC